MSLARCHKHQQQCGWRCSVCRKYLCPDCVALKRVHFHTSLTVCLECGELAEPVTIHRAAQQSYLERLIRAPLWPLQKQGFMMMAGIGLIRAFLSYSPLGAVIGECMMIAACFAMLRASARGSGDFDAFDSTDLVGDILLPGFKGLVAFCIAFLPAGIYAGYTWQGPATFASPLFWLLLLIGGAYAPMAVMFGAAGSLLGMFNPVAMTRVALRFGGNYLYALGALALLAIPWLLFSALGTVINTLIPFLGPIVDYTLACYVPFVAVRVLGLLLFTHGDLIGYGPDSDYLVPVLPGAEPRGVLPEVPAEQQRPQRSYAPIELPEEPAVANVVVPPPEPQRPRELDPATLPPLKTEEE
jgi:hypothetical protein